jgi:hypothetical protein
VTADEEDDGQQHKNAGDQRRSSEEALTSTGSPADAHHVISTSGFMDGSQHVGVLASSIMLRSSGRSGVTVEKLKAVM